ncbi:calcium-binding protein [Rhodobacter capsulatus]|uniref:calcium-binding protein n=1 Tax=Rhodobacter capsulatus TaxID=1061 RepID=UPI0040298878
MPYELGRDFVYALSGQISTLRDIYISYPDGSLHAYLSTLYEDGSVDFRNLQFGEDFDSYHLYYIGASTRSSVQIYWGNDNERTDQIDGIAWVSAGLWGEDSVNDISVILYAQSGNDSHPVEEIPITCNLNSIREANAQVAVIDSNTIVVAWQDVVQIDGIWYPQNFHIQEITYSPYTSSQLQALQQIWDAIEDFRTTATEYFNAIADAALATPALREVVDWRELARAGVEQLAVVFDGFANDDIARSALDLSNIQDFTSFLSQMGRWAPSQATLNSFLADAPNIIANILHLADGMEAIRNTIASSNVSYAYEFLDEYVPFLIGDRLASLAFQSGAGGFITGSLSTIAGLSNVGLTVMSGGTSLVIGYGAGLAAQAINERFELTANFEAMTSIALVNIRSSLAYPEGYPDDPQISGTGFICGGDSDQTLTGSIGNDTIFGAGGDDTLIGAGGSDRLIGGRGSDVYYVDNSGVRVIESNLLAYSSDIDSVYSSVSFEMGTGIEFLRLRGDTDLSGVGNASNNTIYGNAGDNTLKGKAGDDFLSGLSGDDNLYGGSGNNTLNGGSGHDTIWISTNSNNVIVGGAEQDTIRFLNDFPDGIGIDLRESRTNTDWGWRGEFSSIENIVGSAGNDRIIGNAGANALSGMDGDDQISGADGRDTIRGGIGSDTLSGNSGADLINGGGGSDIIRAGNGADTINGDTGRDLIYLSTDQASDVIVVSSVIDSRGRGNDVVEGFELSFDHIDLSMIDANINRAGHQAFSYQNHEASYGIWLDFASNGDGLVRGDVDGDSEADFQIRLSDICGILTQDNFIF